MSRIQSAVLKVLDTLEHKHVAEIRKAVAEMEGNVSQLQISAACANLYRRGFVNPVLGYKYLKVSAPE